MHFGENFKEIVKLFSKEIMNRIQKQIVLMDEVRGKNITLKLLEQILKE